MDEPRDQPTRLRTFVGEKTLSGPEILRACWPIAVFVVLGLLSFSPFNPFDTTQLPNGSAGDPPQMAWFLAWTPYALLHGHNPFFTNLLDYPSGVDLASNTSVPLLGLLAAPITLTLGPIAALNALTRLALIASAASTFFVLRRWCRSRLACFVGGLVYGFGPYIATHVRAEVHLDLIFLPIPPLLALVFDEACRIQRRSAVRTGIVAGLLAVAQLLISAEVLSDCAIVAVIVLAVVAIAHRQQVRSHFRHACAAGGTAAATFTILGGYPVYAMFGGREHLSGPIQSVRHLQSFRVDLLEPFLPSAHQLLTTSHIAHATAVATNLVVRAGGGAELGGYLGIPLVAVLIVVVVKLRRDPLVVALCSAAAAALVLSFGSRLELDGHLSAIPLPEALFAHLPLLDNTIPARFGFVVALCSAMILAIGIDRLVADWRDHTRAVWSKLVPGAAVLLTLVSLAPAGLLVRERPAYASGPGPTLDTLVAKGSVALTYPIPDAPYDEAMLWQATSDMRFSLIGGYATVPGPGGDGRYWPPLLDPAAVQEVFTESFAGRARHYPAAPSTAFTPAVLCRFVATYKVDAVIVADDAPRLSTIEPVLRTALGQPRTTANGLSVWSVTGANPCHS